MELKECTIKVQYYAIFREQAGKSEELLKTLSGTAEELYYELQNKYNFSLAIELVKVAINNEYAPLDQELKEKDEILFIAPLAGG